MCRRAPVMLSHRVDANVFWGGGGTLTKLQALPAEVSTILLQLRYRARIELLGKYGRKKKLLLLLKALQVETVSAKMT